MVVIKIMVIGILFFILTILLDFIIAMNKTPDFLRIDRCNGISIVEHWLT